MPNHPNMKSIADILQRSDALDATITRILNLEAYEPAFDSARVDATISACGVSLEHGVALRILMATESVTSAISLLRLQYEALTRSFWLLYAATDANVAKVQEPLTPTSERAAKNLPGLAEMLSALAGKGPSGATEMLTSFRTVAGHALNSFVHGGIHPLQRHREGYPVPLLVDVIRNSNALVVMTGMMLANLSGDEDVSTSMSKIQPSFADCLPVLLPSKTS
jgi:hypothetical protein